LEECTILGSCLSATHLAGQDPSPSLSSPYGPTCSNIHE
jgi:hypothetical protein